MKALTKLPLNQLSPTDLVSVFRLLISKESPFFTVLAYNCKFIPVENGIPVAGTDGIDVYFNVHVFKNFTLKEVTGVFLHEILHIAYSHILRCKNRDKKMWNIAGDIFINQLINELSFCSLPAGGVLEPDLWRDNTEEIYELLKQNPELCEKYSNGDPLETLLGDLMDPGQLAGENPADRAGAGNSQRPPTPADLEQAAAKWKDLLEVAAQAQADKRSKYGSLSNQLQRTLDLLRVPQVDWRQALMKYLINCPNDYAGFDRRFIAEGFYTENLEGSTVRVDVCIDTSGSIGNEELSVFVTELVGIITAYPQIDCNLYWADTEAFGPYNIEKVTDIPAAEGGGGTCFRDFFKKVAETSEKPVAPVAIYLTDGYGRFPDEPPADTDTLWIVTKDGLNLKDFPFGEAVKLIN
jgi:predicted metal-dependent peptidase